MRVLRHRIDITDQQVIHLPHDGRLLSVAQARANPDRTIDVWSLDYHTGPPTDVEVVIIGTGNPISDTARDAILSGTFLGTVVTPAGLVWHVWQGAYR